MVVVIDQETDGGRALMEELRPATNLFVRQGGTDVNFTRLHQLRLEEGILTSLNAAMAAGRL